MVRLLGSKEAVSVLLLLPPREQLAPKGRNRLLGSEAHCSLQLPWSSLGTCVQPSLSLSLSLFLSHWFFVEGPRPSCVPSPLFSQRLNVLMQAAPSFPSGCFPGPLLPSLPHAPHPG